MATRRRPRRSGRTRIGNVSLYLHRNSWWLYFRERGVPHRRRLGKDVDDAHAVAAQVNADLARQQPTMLSFRPATVQDLRDCWLDHHEHILRSSLATICRYRTATEYLVKFATEIQPVRSAHEVQPELFLRWLRAVQVAPNGHAHTAKRTLRDKGVKFVLGSCRSMFTYGVKHRMMPPYADNPFSSLRIERLPIEDAKPIHVFNADEEDRFLGACDPWQFPMFYLLAKTGLRSGELVHLLVEDVDLDAGILHINNKADLGWQVKTRNLRSIPLPAEPLAMIRHIVQGRPAGVLLVRRQFQALIPSPAAGKSRKDMAAEIMARVKSETLEPAMVGSRSLYARVAARIWAEAGAIDTDDIRTSFMQVTRRIGLPHVTCPKCWRHTYATAMQEAGVDPLVRQLTMGHVPAGSGHAALGMTSVYTHTQIEFHRRELQRVIDLRPGASQLAKAFLSGPLNFSEKESET